jgi:hypothetical protein
MRDNIALDRALEQYLNWKPSLPVTLSPERRLFQSACARWDASNKQHQQQEAQRQQQQSDVVPLIAEEEDLDEITFAKPPDDGEMLSAPPDKEDFDDVCGDGQVAKKNLSGTPPHAPAHTISEVPVQTRLSRTFRVFAAWKL